MFCGNCGTQLPDDAKFCGVCGNPVQSVATPGNQVVVALDETSVPEVAEPEMAELEVEVPVSEPANNPDPLPTPVIEPIQPMPMAGGNGDKTMILEEGTGSGNVKPINYNDTLPVGGGRTPVAPPSPYGLGGSGMGGASVPPLPVPPPKPQKSGGMGIIIAVLVVLIIAIIAVGMYIAVKAEIITLPEPIAAIFEHGEEETCDHVDEDEDGICDKCDEKMPGPKCKHKDKDEDGICDKCKADMPKEVPECKHKDKDDDGVCDKCGEDVGGGEPEPATDVEVDELLKSKLDELNSQAKFNLDDTYYSDSNGDNPEDASAGSPDGVTGIVWSDIRDCDGDDQNELVVLNIVPTSSNDKIVVYKFQVYEVVSDGVVSCEDKKTFNLEKYQIYTIENAIYQTDDAIYLISRQHRYKFKDGGKESFDMIALKYDGSGEMEKWDTDSNDVGPDAFKELFDEIGMSKTADDMSKKYEINYKDDLEQINFMRAKPSLYLSEPDAVSEMQYDFYKLYDDMDAAYQDDKRSESKIPL